MDEFCKELITKSNEKRDDQGHSKRLVEREEDILITDKRRVKTWTIGEGHPRLRIMIIRSTIVF